MSDTIIEQITKEFIDDLMIKEPEFAPIIFSSLKNLRKGFYKPQNLVDAIFQKYEKDDINIYDAYCFLQVWTGLLSGKIFTANIMMFNRPYKNSQVIENNQLLTRLVHPFKAEFIPSQSGDDGYFEWVEEIKLKSEIVSENETKVECIDVKPMWVPLEIGYTSAQKTYEYLFMNNGALARFPYNSSDIVILYNKDFEKDRSEFYI